MPIRFSLAFSMYIWLLLGLFWLYYFLYVKIDLCSDAGNVYCITDKKEVIKKTKSAAKSKYENSTPTIVFNRLHDFVYFCFWNRSIVNELFSFRV